uniref:LRRCT domain-containing protein n=1 Tax=Erpetoichthys calabaricus TaxID=27687 RepID=A0A8C4SPD1_ERPCA
MILWLSSPNSLSWLECPKGCDCQGVFKFVNCSCAFLTIIPSSLPMDTEHFDLSRNNLSVIPQQAFTSLMTRLRRLYLQHNNLVVLSNGVFSTLQQLEVLNLEGNQINSIDVEYKTFLSIHTFGTHILLADNPWQCDCDLQRVFRKLLSVQRLVFDDYVNLTCKEPAVLNGCKLADVNNRLCIGETVTVLIITFTVLVTVVAAIVMAERNRKKRTGKHWSEECDLSYDSQD